MLHGEAVQLIAHMDQLGGGHDQHGSGGQHGAPGPLVRHRLAASVQSPGQKWDEGEGEQLISDQGLHHHKGSVARGCPHVRVGHIGLLTLRTGVKKVLMRSSIAPNAQDLIFKEMELG